MRTLTALLCISAAALTACIGRIGDRDEGAGGPEDPPDTTPTNFSCDPAAAALTGAPIRRLAKLYLQNAVGDFLSQMSEESRQALLSAMQTRFNLVPTDSSDFYSHNDERISQDHVDAVFNLAMSMAASISDETNGYATELLTPCGAGLTKSALDDDACLTTFIEYYGRKAFRRPLEAAEVDDFKAYYQQSVAAELDGMAALVGRLVAHPRFYYRLDAEGEDAGESSAVYRLSKWELLSKITFLFWASPPTDELYDRVVDTDITEDDALAALIDDVLADPRAQQGLLRFYGEWLELEKTPAPATEGNPVASEALIAAAGLEGLPEMHREDMMQEVLDLAMHYTFATEGTLDELLESPYSFAKSPALAAIYGVEPWNGTADHLVSLPADQRSGLLTRAAFVASNAEYTRPVQKGKLIRTRILCWDIPPPPPDANVKPVTHPADQTTRQDFEAVTGNPACASCHSTMNPLGFASESYDPLGRFRTMEMRFDAETGEVVGEVQVDTRAVVELPDAEPREVADAIQLGAYLAESRQPHTCLVRNYFEFVTGRQEDFETDGCDLDGLHKGLAAEGGSIKNMLRESVLMQSFRKRKVMTEGGQP